MKDKLKKFLKMAQKQIAALLCALLVIVGIVLAYWPTQKLFTDLQAKVDASIGVGNQVSGLLKKERHLPNISFDPNAAPLVLGVYPTDDIYQKGLASVKSLGTNSQSLLDAAVELNQHVPLSPGALPAGDDLARAQFRSAYIDALNDDSRIRNWPPADLKSIPPLVAGRRISDDDIKNAEADIQAQIDIQFPPALANGQPNPDAVAQGKSVFDERTKNLALSLEYEAAKKCKVYLETGAIKHPTVYDDFKNATSALPVDSVWSAQLALWIDEDVATAVARANADAATVMDSPVKQILDVTIKDPPYVISGDPTAGKEDAALTPVYDLTPTGRVSNGMYDVVQFSLTIDADASRIPAVLDALQHGQFITILSVQSEAVDGYERAAQRFIYGNCPVVHLTLVCEELLLHAWINKFQPPDAGAAKYATGAATTGLGASLVPITLHTGG